MATTLKLFAGRFAERLLNVIGIDRGSSGDREVSVGYFGGAPTIGMSTPAIGQYIALASSGLTFRKLFLPPASPSVRQQVVQEELSYSLPFPLAEAHFGAVENGEEAWVAIASEEVVEPIRELYPKAKLEVEPLCYMRAAKAAGIDSALVVDLGASKTVFCTISDGRVETVRVLMRGGDRLTADLAKGLGCSREDAEFIKRDEGTEHKLVRQFFSEMIEEALLPDPLPQRRILLCGGGSATPGLLRFLADVWGKDVDVEPFPLPGLLMATDHVIAFGAALAGRPKATRIQMKHSFRAQSDSAEKLRLAPIFLTLLLAGLMILSLETRMGIAQRREVELKQSLLAAVEPVTGKIQYTNGPELVKSLRNILEKQRRVGRSSPGRIMNTLGRSSEAVTSKKDAAIFSMIYEDDKLKLEGQTKSLSDSDDIKQSLKSVMVGLEQVKTRPTTNDNFIFQIEGQLPEQ